MTASNPTADFRAPHSPSPPPPAPLTPDNFRPTGNRLLIDLHPAEQVNAAGIYTPSQGEAATLRTATVLRVGPGVKRDLHRAAQSEPAVVYDPVEYPPGTRVIVSTHDTQRLAMLVGDGDYHLVPAQYVLGVVDQRKDTRR